MRDKYDNSTRLSWRAFRALLLAAAAMLFAFQTQAGAAVAAERKGLASFYGAGEPLNEDTAMNLPFDARLMECASWDFPLGSVLEVTSLRTGRTVIVRCTDRGPAKRLGRLVDLTARAFASIDDPAQGLTPVRVRRIK